MNAEFSAFPSCSAAVMDEAVIEGFLKCIPHMEDAYLIRLTRSRFDDKFKRLSEAAKFELEKRNGRTS